MLELKNNNELIIGFSDKTDGNFRNPANNSNAGELNDRRQKFFRKLGINPDKVFSAELVHGNKINVLTDETTEKYLLGCDAIITNVPGRVLTITAADCLPIYFYDPKKKVIGLAHSGWRGVIANVAGLTAESIKVHYGSNPEDIEVYIGPHIRECHFTVQDDVQKIFSPYPDFISDSNPPRINLSGIVKTQLLAAGLREKNINISLECTYCETEKFFSFRRDHPKELETMIAYIGLKM